MCGICGKLSFREQVIERELIAKMCSTLVHRGPDDERIYTGPHIGLGQRRLSIIDLSRNAAAPLTNEDKTVWVICNGEIYNFQKLRSELTRKGHVFYTRSDTEVIVHLYEDYGIKCLDKMRGMFALAIWDVKEKRLFAARDRLGKKPFCYTKTRNSFIFGSEIKAIAEDTEVSLSPNFQAIDSYLSYQYVPSPLTAFEGIHKLPPGHYLTCSVDGNLEVHRYWNPSSAQKTKASEQEIREEILRLLRESVRLRMISDVPLGAFLSGGIDSTTVVALMAQESSQPVKTFSIGFEEDNYNELPYARLLAQRYNTDHHEFILKPDVAEVLPLLVKHYNEPFADSSAIPTYYISKVTRQHVTVALSGDGGDENFAGYNRYPSVLNWSKFDALPFVMRNLLAGSFKAAFDTMPYHNTTARLCRGLTMLQSRLKERYLLQISTLKPQERRMIYSEKFNNLIAGRNDFEDAVAMYPWNKNIDAMDWMMCHDLNFYLPDCLMVKTDIASMANSLEVRCPLLDHRFVEFAATIPSSMKRNGNDGKVIMKAAAKNLLPSKIFNKHKSGFSIPLAKWFREELADLLKATLLDDRAMRRGLFNPQFIRKMIGEQLAGQRDWSYRLWAFLFLEMWFREFID
jgi:asparagine synthase (glutamine-hydrolysing)